MSIIVFDQGGKDPPMSSLQFGPETVICPEIALEWNLE